MLSRKRCKTFAAQLCVSGFLWSAVFAGPVMSKEAIRIEGEDYTTSCFNQHGWYQNTNIMKDLLSPGRPGVSDGDWHTHFTGGGSPEYATATYQFNIAEGGTCTWWIRLNPFRNQNGGGNYSYKVDGGSWQNLDVSEASKQMIDLVDILPPRGSA